MRAAGFPSLALLLVTTIGVQAAPVVQYPPGAVAGGTYTVKPSEAKQSIENLVLPDGFTLKLDPSIRTIHWSVKRLSFGINAVFDVSSPQAIPDVPRQLDRPPQANACDDGIRGYIGTPGRTAAGPLWVVIKEIEKVDPKGSLWVKTNGAPGGQGGKGSDGGMGGGRGGTFWSHCGPNKGGIGGDGGPGAPGGQTTSVAFVKRGDSLSYLPNNCPAEPAPACGPVATFDGASGNTGTITAWGGVGCGGAGGEKGYAGPGGGEGAGYGDDGNVRGAPGALGRCAGPNEALSIIERWEAPPVSNYCETTSSS
jgi:hypothetical protein